MISCDYYRNGSLKSLRDVSGRTLIYTYNEAGRLAELKDEEGNTLTEYDYTAAGRIKEIRTSNGITTSYKYDSDGNISRLTMGNGTEEGLFYDAFMLYDLNGNRLGKTGQRMGLEGKQEMNTVYCYDAMNRLTMENRREGGEKYTYDLGGNRLSRQRYHYALNASGSMDSVIDDEESYCYNERNELTERKRLSVLTNYLYDANGSLIREKEGEKETGYRYDLLNRQTHVHLPDGREQENLYDGEGLRAGLKESNRISTFLYYNGEILAECDRESMPVRRHLTGLGLSGVEDISTGTRYTYHQDEQGSTAYVTGTTREIENFYSYDGFGNVLEKKETITNRILYAGQQYDQETGQYYLRARYYNPVIGRFTQEDTYRGDGLNLYAYCGNNPVMYYDPSGHGMIDSIGAALTGCPVETNASQKNTQAEKVAEGSSKSAKDTISDRVQGLDLNEHPTDYKQLSNKKMQEIKSKIDSRTATREEYDLYDWNKRLDKRREKGVNNFWDQERERITHGETPTRNWTEDQIKDILEGNKPTYNDSTIQGHHSYSVSKYPHLADKGEVIYPATHNEHFNGWHGGNYRNSLPGEPIVDIIDF